MEQKNHLGCEQYNGISNIPFPCPSKTEQQKKEQAFYEEHSSEAWFVGTGQFVKSVKRIFGFKCRNGNRKESVD
ncbi:hypothetical protein [Marinomonas aquiplantarum]|uniref:Uncharacterized protein n=1 Tax=Marinomonas aquiplantarum TaxID=491951 RepID=A0A366D5J8_9GAMM|nr:hypothetical protein [Marinomonas aquiplantarum]RBO84754.1 hypothetical protein DFP76_102151 [Marinomonas aquiplantarum]